jgi:hypothetical protein
MPFLDEWIAGGDAIERSSRCLLFLLKVRVFCCSYDMSGWPLSRSAWNNVLAPRNPISYVMHDFTLAHTYPPLSHAPGLQVHHNQLVANDEMVPVMQSLKTHVPVKVTALKDTIGFNMAALRFLEDEVKAAGIRTFEDAEAVASGAGVATKRLKLVK